MGDEQHDAEITSNGNTAAIEEDELELTLSLRPINSFSSYDSKNLLQTFSLPVSTDNARHQILFKRDAQAIRRHEAKLKRDLKRKAQVCVKNEAVLLVGGDNQRDDFMPPCGKVPNLGFQVEVAPPWLGWNGGCYGGGFGRTFQGQNGNFASEGKDCASFSSGDSSSISDNHQSNSGAGANSSDAGSHSSHPHTQLLPSSVPSSISEPPACSSQLDLRPNDSNSNPSKPQSSGSYSNKLGLASSTTPSTESPKGVTTSSNSTCQQNGASPNVDKGSRPNDLTGQEKLLFSQMPCVSTTGNGPNAKTITGFLYKYTKAEVSIICVCHGSSFSPAEFVEHAGGVDVEYPLRHIRVVPFALG